MRGHLWKQPPIRGRLRTPPEPEPEPEPEPQPEPPADEPYYENCDAARAAGDTPLYAGNPGYRSGLDRDDDGIACE